MIITMMTHWSRAFYTYYYRFCFRRDIEAKTIDRWQYPFVSLKPFMPCSCALQILGWPGLDLPEVGARKKCLHVLLVILGPSPQDVPLCAMPCLLR